MAANTLGGMTRAIAELFLKLSIRECKSKSVAASLRLVGLEDGSWAVESPYYWAVYYHDGRGPVRAKPGKVLVYFKDIEKDPRVSGRKYPERAADIKRLTKKQFYEFLKDPSRGMVTAKSVGPTEGDPFFIRAEQALSNMIGKLVAARLSAIINDCFKDLFDFEGGVSVLI